MKILGIETSCDETAASIAFGKKGTVEILSNVVSSQIDIHKKYGGVVPEVAAREHVLNILPVVNEALLNAGINRNNAFKEIDVIAVTAGPGLISSLLIGVETAKALSYVWKLPIVSVNHIEGHIYSNFIFKPPSTSFQFPIIVLTVSGGHTMLVLMKGLGKFKTIGQTRDDAAGEAFDKAAKLMNLGYPGGPVIYQYAQKAGLSKQKSIKLPRPMIDKGEFDFSFSGLKTALLYEIQHDADWRKRIPEYAREFQQSIVDVLTVKTIKAAKYFQAKTIMLAGGVAANSLLREELQTTAKKEGFKFNMPELKYTTDNAAMIATAGYFKSKQKQSTSWQKIKVDCNLSL